MRLPATVPSFVPVKDSSNVQGISYDPKGNFLYIQFLPDNPRYKGPVYKYWAFPEQEYRRFLKAKSKGTFVWQYIRDRYRYKRWTGFGWRTETVLKRRATARKMRRRR